MRINFGAKWQIDQGRFNNPQTGQRDTVGERMERAVAAAFQDEISRFVLDNTRDEVVLTGQRVNFQTSKGIVPGFNLKVRLAGLLAYPDTEGFTVGFNPFNAYVPGKKLQGLLQGKLAVLNQVLARHQMALELSPRG